MLLTRSDSGWLSQELASILAASFVYLAGPDGWMRHCSEKGGQRTRRRTFVLCEGSKKPVGRTGEGGAEWLEYEADMWACLSRTEVQMRIQKAVRKILHSTGVSVVL